MNYQETLDFLYTSLPMYQRVGKTAYKADLDNTLALCKALGNPERQIKTVHVAGTNGKGSSSHMLSAILQTAGYKTGLYTSPHLKSFTERIKVDGINIGDSAVVKFVENIKDDIETIRPSFFEITVAMAFDYFKNEKVDIAIIEVGLGGRLDSTNVINPEVALITNIGHDHQHILGNTLSEIANEKAGIIKQGKPVVISEYQPEIAHVFASKANGLKASIYNADKHIYAEQASPGRYNVIKDGEIKNEGVALQLTSGYQLKNLNGVIAVIDILNEKGYDISESSVSDGLEQINKLTGLKGRWQQIGKSPTVICDTGHNIEGVTSVLSQLEKTSYKNLWIIWGMVDDKEVKGILSILPTSANYLFCNANIPRAMGANKLQQLAADVGIKGAVIEDVNEAIMHAKNNAEKEDLIFVGGSTFVVAEIEAL